MNYKTLHSVLLPTNRTLMETRIFFLLLASLSAITVSIGAEPARIVSKITVTGVVYCDICSTNSFSKHSYFLPGVQVHIDCKFNAESPTTSEQMSFSVNRTTNKSGVYKLEIPSIDGVKCAEEPLVQLLCQASLIGSSSSSCNVPGSMMKSDQMIIKSKQRNHCVYCFNALNYKTPKRNVTLCEKHKVT